MSHRETMESPQPMLRLQPMGASEPWGRRNAWGPLMPHESLYPERCVRDRAQKFLPLGARRWTLGDIMGGGTRRVRRNSGHVISNRSGGLWDPQEIAIADFGATEPSAEKRRCPPRCCPLGTACQRR